jgi:type II secretory pathway component GspD/PulD (secretin)
MKRSVRITLVGLFASTYISVGAADENKPAEPPAPPPAAAPADSAPAVPEQAQEQEQPVATPEAPAQVETPASAPEATKEAPATAPGAPTETPAGPDGTEVVPLIVIDDVPLTDAIRNLARQSGLNFQFDPRVTAPTLGPDGKPLPLPSVSFRWENVSAHDALVALLDNYNLVLLKDPQSRISKITVKDPKAEEPLISRIVQLKYADPTNLVTLLKPNLTARSQVLSDIRTAQLIVSTTAREWETVSNIVTKLDTPTKQVLIESRMLETAKNPTSIRGIDWANTFEGQKFTFGNAANGRISADTARAFNPSTAFLNADGVNAVLSWLNKEADTEVVATPRAVTMDNQMATLQVTKAYPIIKVTPGSANSPAGAEITYTNIGVILQVTPRITANNYISLKVIPEVSNIDSKDSQEANGDTFTANVYAIRRADTHVMIPSGNTLVMGGLISDTVSTTLSKVPLLGDAPGLGGLFRHKKNVRNKQNLIIFITPTVVDDESFAANDRGMKFLKTKYEDTPDKPDSIWDSAHPADWTKPRRSNDGAAK